MKLKTLLVSAVALLCSAASWAGTVDYTSKMSNNTANWTGVGSQTPINVCKTNGVETYQGNDTQFAIGDVLYQTISDLPNGFYKISFYAWENFAPWNEQASISYGDGIAQVFANSAAKDINVIKDKDGRAWDPANTYTLIAQVTEGTLKYGVKNVAAGGNWAACKPISLTYLGETTIDENTDLTCAISNPSFETGNKIGWTDDSGTPNMDIQDNAALDGKDGNYYIEKWWESIPLDLNQTLPTLPAGYYRITARALAEDGNAITLYGKAGSNDEVTKAVTEVNDYSIEVYQSIPGTIKLGLKGSHSAQTHVAFDNFRLTYLGNPYPALEETIDEAEGKTLGFEVGEYAPYMNVAALSALASAKDINEAKTASYDEVIAATTALTSATWTVNTELMDAIYDGRFASYGAEELNLALKENSIKFPGGWLHNNDVSSTLDHIRQIATFTSFVGGRAMFFHNGSVSYGQTTGYTMPLKANSVYKFSFQYAGWGEYGTNAPSVSILNESGEGKTLSALPEGGPTPSSGATRYTVYFATDATPGSYTLTYQSPDNTNSTIGDLSFIRVDALTLNQSSAVNYVAGTYPSVTLPRELSTTNWNTLCLPFATPVSDYAAVRELTDIDVVGDHVSITFTDVAETLVAGKPYLVKGKGESSISATDVAVLTAPASAPSVTEAGATVIYNGIFAPIAAIPQNAGNYVVSSNNLYLVDSSVSLKGYRGYFNVSVPASVKSLALNFDDADVIKALEAAENEKSVIYNLAGQRLSKAQKGVNIINGKKVLVK